ncbi:hypothetical protein Egran_03829 [Elaphomyces granulatus]|uniref:Mediator of RNA polymerase II transcription subunit 14 n=1 Tax=Elaphomyces granulatus TaxID=519963 RepID=A0A232LW78_9EURO|nr:hypothetical protein Egran_03829 [Elaphomyces granulatus]
MPGIIMDKTWRGTSTHNVNNNGISSLPYTSENDSTSLDLKNRSRHLNGLKERDRFSEDGTMLVEKIAAGDSLFPPTSQLPELVHITQGFFPFAQLVSRSVQQCWNDLSDLIAELADLQTLLQNQVSQFSLTNGKSPGNQSEDNMQKKLRILDFAQLKRTEFIKLLVLSRWSRQAIDVSKLIDLQGFIRTRHLAYHRAPQRVADMKRDLVRAQMANPDLKTALEILSKGRAGVMLNLGYLPPKPLSPRRMLNTLRKLNKIISTRLLVHDFIPASFRTYLVHDGRVTFYVPGEFEIDLSIAEESHISQFFFIDIRFLFSPSSPIPIGRLSNDLDFKINNVLRTESLVGCFGFLHNMVLTNKVIILFKQAMRMARESWSDSIHVELLHRTLIVQYWVTRTGLKSWLEIGIRSGRQNPNHENLDDPGMSGVPRLSLRWVRENLEADNDDITFDTENLSMESILRSAIALHASHLLHAVYDKIRKRLLYSSHSLSLRARFSTDEPGDCSLEVQLTRSRYLRVLIEPTSGVVTTSITPSLLSRLESDNSVEKFSTDDIVNRISRLRCIAAMEEIESNARILGLEINNHRRPKNEGRRLFPPNVLRSYFWHRHWERNWVVAATSSMDGDDWWVIRMKPATRPLNGPAPDGSVPQSARNVTGSLLFSQQCFGYPSLGGLELSLAGMLAIHANAHYLAELNCLNSFPPLQKLQFGASLKVPTLYIRFELLKLPPTLQILPPDGLRGKSHICETIRLSFRGFDKQAKAVIMIADGKLKSPIRGVGKTTLKSNHSLVFPPSGCRFAIRFLAAAGKPIITELFDHIQRLEFILSIIDSLHRKKAEIYSISLSRVSFGYGSSQDLSARIVIKQSEPSNLADLEPATLLSQTKPLFRLRMSIDFDPSSPHRRIKESFATILNQDGANTSLDSVIELLAFTLPLLRSLDRITDHGSKVHVTARNAKTYNLRYSDPRFRFLVTASQHRDSMGWMLKDIRTVEDRSERSEVENYVQERIFNSNGEGWRGLGSGVVADADKVGNLIVALDSCFLGGRIMSGASTGHGDRKDDGKEKPTSLNQQGGRNRTSLDKSRPVNPPTRVATKYPLQNSEISNDADVIMID